MAKPFVDPLDEEADAAEGAAVGKHAGKLRERISAVADDDTSEIEVTEPDEEDEEETEAVPSRKDKRRARLSAREARVVAETEARVLREALQMTGRPQPQEQGQRQGNPYEHIDAQIRKTYLEAEALEKRWVSTFSKSSPEEIQRMKDEAAELDVRRIGLVADRKELERAPRRAEEARIHDQRSRFPDVFADTRAFQYAQGTYNQALARGQADSRELQDAAFLEARQVILGVRPKPDAAQRQRASSASPGRHSAPGEERTVVAMPRGSALYKMACAMYPNLEPPQACQKWAQKNGKPYAEAARARAR